CTRGCSRDVCLDFW
nr:immunoglobulin heavy chain junction region [Macaca mulatta]